MKNFMSVIKNCFKKLGLKKESNVNDEGKLYPKSLTEKEMEPYSDQLEQVIVDKKVKNVAITGPYGIGKSSVLETYFQDNDLKKKTIFVNLPDFWQVGDDTSDQNNKENVDKNDDGNDNEREKESSNKKHEESTILDDTTVDESVLQRKILEQIIFGADINAPFMTMRKSNTIPMYKVLLFVILSFLLVPSIVGSFLRWNWKYTWFTSLRFWEWIAILIVVFFIGYLLWKVINLIKISKISMKVFGQGIAFEEKKNLPFSKYAEDLINFFEYSNKEYIIIEDLDRYEYTSIYKELRDLNHLINRSLSNKKRVVFIYALRDTLIVESKEKSSVDTKAKFFDYVIPILSNTSFNNGFETLSSELGKISINDAEGSVYLNTLFEEKDLRLLGYYLNGDRTIKLIAAETKQLVQRVLSYSNNESSNEKNTIKRKIEYIGISAKEVLGSVIYKNFYPHEYEKSRNHEAEIDKINDALQSIIFKMNADISNIENKILELEDSIEEYQNDTELTSEELKKIIVTDFLKSIKERIVYFRVNNKWIALNLENIDSAYKDLINKLGEYDSENIIFYKNRSAVNSNKVKSISKSKLKKGKYKFSYEKFINVETVGEQVKEWKYQKMKNEQRKEFLEKQNDFSVIFTFLKEKDMEDNYINIETQGLKRIIRKIDKNKLKDMLFSNGFVTLNFNNILSSFPNSKLNGNDREIIENATLGNTIELDQTINDVKEVIKELNRIEINYSNIESYNIAKNLFEVKSEDSEDKLNLILQKWREKHRSIACYLAFNSKNYRFMNHILSEWTNGLLNENNEIMNLNSFFLMLVDENITVELAKQPYMRAINTTEACELLNQFIKENDHLAKQVLENLDGKIEISYISVFDYDVLQLMTEYNLFNTETRNIEQMVKANFDNVFNFGSLATYLSDFIHTSLVSKILNKDEFLHLIEDINERSEELLDNEDSLETLLLLINLLKENIDDPNLLILELLAQAKFEKLELSLDEKQKLTEIVEIHELVSELDNENYEMINSFTTIVEKNILKYSEKYISWFKVVDMNTKKTMLNEIFNQNDNKEGLLNEFISTEEVAEIPNLYDINTPIELKYILLKIYSGKYFFKEHISDQTANQMSQYVLNSRVQDEQILVNLIKRDSVSVEERARFIYMLITDYDYSIMNIADSLSIEDEIEGIMNKNKTEISTEVYSSDIYSLFKALEKLNLTHSLYKKKEKIYYRLKKVSEKYI